MKRRCKRCNSFVSVALTVTQFPISVQQYTSESAQPKLQTDISFPSTTLTRMGICDLLTSACSQT